MIQKLQLSKEIETELLEELPHHDAPCLRFNARWIDSPGELEELSPRWRRLGEIAIRENLQFDPSFLIPAFRHLNDRHSRVLVVEAPQINNPDSQVLCGLIPLRKSRIYRLPLNGYEIWRHDQCLDATPLIRGDCANEVLTFVFEFLQNAGASLLSMDTVSAQSRFGDVLREVVQNQNLSVFQRDQISRAAFRPRATVDEFIAANVSKSVRKNVGRLERRLREKGDLQIEVSGHDSDYATLAQQFLELEASGWKGKQGTALASQPCTKKFFEEMVSRSAAANRVSFLSMTLNAHPVAMLCDLYANGFGCSYKTAFDENYSQFSPGLLAEIHNIEHMHNTSIVQMDSCTDPGNATINRIWKDQIKYQSVVIALHRGIPKLATTIMPWLQSIARTARRPGKS